MLYRTSDRAVRGGASNSFLELWRDGTEVFGRALDELLGSRETEPELWKRVNGAVRLGRPFGEHVARHTVTLGREHKLRWRARSVAADPSRGALTLFVLDELSVD